MNARLAVHAALAGHERAIDGDGVHSRSHAADGETDDVAFVAQVARDAGKQNGEFARVHIRQVPVGIEGHDVRHVRGVALQRNGGRAAFAHAADVEGLQLINSRG